MNNYIKIQLQRIPGKYPDKSYVDIKYYPDRVVPRPEGYSEIIKTEKKFQLINDVNYLNRIIQSVSFNKYELTIFADETLEVADFDLAETVTIVAKNGVTHLAKIIEILEPERIENTNHLIYRIIYYDANPANYKDNTSPVNNYLEKAAIIEDYSDAQLWRLIIATNRTIDTTFTSLGNTYTFYTKLNIEEVSENTPIYVNDKTKDLLAQGVLRKRYRLRFYLSLDDYNILQKYGNLCDSIKFSLGISNYISVSNIEIDSPDNDAFINLREVNVTITTEISASEYLESDTIKNISAVSSIRSLLTVTYASTDYLFYTILDPDFNVEVPEIVDVSLPNGKKKITKKVYQDSIDIAIYLNETNKNTLKKILDIATSVVFNYNSTNYTSVEPIIPEFEKVENAINLYLAKITLKYDSQDVYPLAT